MKNKRSGFTYISLIASLFILSASVLSSLAAQSAAALLSEQADREYAGHCASEALIALIIGENKATACNDRGEEASVSNLKIHRYEAEIDGIGKASLLWPKIN